MTIRSLPQKLTLPKKTRSSAPLRLPNAAKLPAKSLSHLTSRHERQSRHAEYDGIFQRRRSTISVISVGLNRRKGNPAHCPVPGERFKNRLSANSYTPCVRPSFNFAMRGLNGGITPPWVCPESCRRTFDCAAPAASAHGRWQRNILKASSGTPSNALRILIASRPPAGLPKNAGSFTAPIAMESPPRRTTTGPDSSGNKIPHLMNALPQLFQSQ